VWFGVQDPVDPLKSMTKCHNCQTDLTVDSTRLESDGSELTYDILKRLIVEDSSTTKNTKVVCNECGESYANSITVREV